eukprot:COSAG03_NODE_13057_length_518_cov_1.226730_2_plen_20_part_01
MLKAPHEPNALKYTQQLPYS